MTFLVIFLSVFVFGRSFLTDIYMLLQLLFTDFSSITGGMIMNLVMGFIATVLSTIAITIVFMEDDVKTSELTFK